MRAIFLFPFLLSITLTAQDYTPFVQEGATWINYFSNEFPDYEYRAYKIEGDTIINKAEYKKIYRYDLGSELIYPLTFTDKKYYGALREDVSVKKVYGIVKIDDWGEINVFECTGYDFADDSKEYLLYDFDKEIGDLIEGCQLHENERGSVINRNAMEDLYGATRRVLYNENDMKLIEGVGYEDGIFMQAHTWIHAGWGYGLIDYCRGYNDPDCMLSTSLEPISFGKTKIYPNPTSGILNIVSDVKIKNVELSNLSGALIKVFQLNNGAYSFNALLQNGIYVLKVTTENNVVEVHKIVISDF